MRDWTACPDGQNYPVFVGFIEVKKSDGLLGFQNIERESNWITMIYALAEAPTEPGKCDPFMAMLGCQIRFISQIDPKCYRLGTSGAWPWPGAFNVHDKMRPL